MLTVKLWGFFLVLSLIAISTKDQFKVSDHRRSVTTFGLAFFVAAKRCM